jgi:hypothetical protein
MGKKKANKPGKDKIPKTIAGVKIPKELRKAGEEMARLAKEPLAREIALAALAAGLAARNDVRKATKQAAADAEGAVEDAAQGTGWVSAALGAAALEAGRRVIEAFEEKGKANGASGKSKLGRTIKAAATVAGGIRH